MQSGIQPGGIYVDFLSFQCHVPPCMNSTGVLSHPPIDPAILSRSCDTSKSQEQGQNFAASRGGQYPHPYKGSFPSHKPKCPNCSKTFSSASNLNRHQKSHCGGSVQAKQLHCGGCMRAFAREDGLRRHLNNPKIPCVRDMDSHPSQVPGSSADLG
jgi:uncharacterized Zn-finger protein